MQAKDELEKRRSMLSTKKQALLEKIVSRKASHAAPPVSIPRRPAELREIAPASFSQQRIWFLEQLEPGTSTYNFSEAWPLKGALDYQALQQSFTEIVRRHAVLRTTFVEVAGKLMQRINDATPLALPVADLRSLPESEREQAAQRLLNEAAQTPFDLQRGPLLRPLLVQLAPQEYILLVSIHHIASDGWSMGIINRELSVLYNALSNGQPSPLPELPIQYADYAVWQRDWLKGETLERQLTYWKKQLAGVPALLALPTNRPRPARQSYQGHTLTFALSRSLLDQLYQLSRSEGVTLFMLLIAAFQILLARYTQQEDLAVGSLIANRRYAEIEPLVGFFVNTLVLRVDLSGNPTFQEFLKRVRDVTLEAYDHQDVPFERVVEAIQPERNLSYNPLFQVLFVLQSGLGEAMSLGNMNRMAIPVENNTAPFDLTFDLGEIATGLRGSLRYNSDIFDRGTMKQLIEHFRILLTGIIAQPDACIWELPLLTEEERQQMLIEPPAASLSSLQEPDFLDLFAAQVRRTPQAIAASADGVEASYQQLDARANFLADQLASLGVGPETRVAVVEQRGLSLLSALLAIFKVSAAYVPIDPAQPVLRVRQLLAGSGAQVVLAGEQVQHVVQQAVELWEPQETAPQMLLLPAWEKSGSLPAFPVAASLPHQLAYVLFTSGSTGAPKGVMIEQKGMLNHLLCKVKALELGAQDRVGQIASQSFDISIWQMLAVLLVGGRVQVVSDEVSHDPRRLIEQIQREHLSVVQLVPSLLGALLDELERLGERRPAFAHLRWLVPTGEALPPELCRRWLALYPHVPLVNAYGPTETSDDVTHALIAQPPAGDCVRVPIGTALENTQLYVLGQYGELLPRGAYGELYIGGKGVGRGYLGDARKTAERFIPDRWSGAVGARLYRTGDVVRFLADGSLEFVGRKDEQVKLRGYRVELGEIEEVIRAQEGVKEVVVVLRDVEGEEKRLVAYVAGQTLSEEQLREAVGKRLPAYMVPWAWVVLDTLPLTSNGKIDRKQLPAPQRSEQDEPDSYRGPRTALEEVLAGIWGELLGIERVGIDENFFALGGHSLLAIRFLAQVRTLLQVELSLRAIFEAPTIASMAAFLLQTQDESQNLEETAHMLLSVAHLSEEEVAALLREEAIGEGSSV